MSDGEVIAPRAETKTVAQWLQALEGADVPSSLHAVYGARDGVLAGRVALLRSVLDTFLERFGDLPVRLFRSPGRINLRGMHVDTHGGYLNLMTHQREVMLAASPTDDTNVVAANIDDSFPDVSFALSEHLDACLDARDWLSFITSGGVARATGMQRGHWRHYMQGAGLAAQFEAGRPFGTGARIVVGSDLPQGAALSSSAALCIAAVQALSALNGTGLGPECLIAAARNAEWYTGSRCGVSDQAAEVLGAPGEVVNVALHAGDLDLSGLRRIQLPGEAKVLVANSYTKRSLSGAQLVDYTRNRFAYSLAMGILREAMAEQGLPQDLTEQAGRLSNLSMDRFEALGGPRVVYELLRLIPETLGLGELRDRYDLPGLDAVYEQYFGSAPPELRPETFDVRGPLLFGIAESERARVFADVLAPDRLTHAGRLMSIGHDGDRRVNRDGSAYRFDVGDAALERLCADRVPVEECPGVYGASSPVLDGLVDAALEAGALGACLTGAGMAGTVLALARSGDAGRVADALRQYLASDEYRQRSGRERPLTADEVEAGVVVNEATAAAGELRLA